MQDFRERVIQMLRSLLKQIIATIDMLPPLIHSVTHTFADAIMSPLASPKAKHVAAFCTASMPYDDTTDTITTSTNHDRKRSISSSMDGLLAEVLEDFTGPTSVDNLLRMSAELQEDYKEKLQSSRISMLPSYNHTLPTGAEKGKFLALDVGGTNFRVALVELCGPQSSGPNAMKMIKLFSFRIDSKVRELKGQEFFGWMADRIQEVISDPLVVEAHGTGTFAMGVAWSFPVEQTSVRTGLLLEMGKGFNASTGVVGEDLTKLIMQACKERDIDVRMDAIINDGSATLLSCAYADPATRFGLILGTGTNASIILPVDSLSEEKLQNRPQSWREQAKEVLVNTEFSMFGRRTLSFTRWDEAINDSHMMPDFQPFEHFIGGRYLGELVRLIMLEAVAELGLFDGNIPTGLETPYTLETSTIAAIEADETAELLAASKALTEQHSLPTAPTKSEIYFIRQVIRAVIARATSLLALAIHSLWTLRLTETGQTANEAGNVTIGCNGSVIERYPCFRAQTQKRLDQLTSASGGTGQLISLELALESAIFGAAVAVGCLEGLE